MISKILKTPFPTERFENYLQQIGVFNPTMLTMDETKKVFLFSITDFQQKALSTDELSSIAMQLLHDAYLTKSHNEQMEHKTFGEVLWGASELDFYLRKSKTNMDFEIMTEYLKKILTFYEENKGK